MVRIVKILSILAGFCVMVLIGAIAMKDPSHTKKIFQADGQIKGIPDGGPVVPETFSTAADAVRSGAAEVRDRIGETVPGIEEKVRGRVKDNTVTSEGQLEETVEDSPKAEGATPIPETEIKRENPGKKEKRIVRKNPGYRQHEEHAEVRSEADGVFESLDSTNGFLMDAGKLLNR